MVTDVNDSDTYDFQSTLIISDTAEPKVTNPRCFVSGLGNVGRINGDSFSQTGKAFTNNLVVESYCLLKYDSTNFRI